MKKRYMLIRSLLASLILGGLTLSAIAGDWRAPGLGWAEADGPAFSVDTRDSVGIAVGESGSFVLNTRSDSRSAVADSGAFTLDTRGGIGMSDSGTSDTFTLDTRTASTVSITISGPSTVAGGNSAVYTSTAIDANGYASDVSAQCAWSVVAPVPSGVQMQGQQLQVASTVVPQNISIQATYKQAAGQLAAAPYVVSITGGGMTAAIKNAQALPTGAGAWTLSADAFAYGRYGDVTARWTLDGSVLTGATTDTLRGYPVSGLPKTRTLAVELTDTHSRTASASVAVTFNKPIAPKETGIQWPAADPVDGDILDSDGKQFAFQTDRISKGLIIITHGIWNSGETDWIKRLASSIAARLITDSKPYPNVCILDWHVGATPSAGDFLALSPLDVVSPFNAICAIHYRGVKEGAALANWIKVEVQAGHIDPTAPLQLIGHSAGGFVMGECLSQLKDQNIYAGPIQVTALDTPYPYKDDAKPVSMCIATPASCRYERYYTEVPGLGWNIPIEWPKGPVAGYYPRYLSLTELHAALLGLDFWNAHSWVHDWYKEETTDFYGDKEEDGFFYSPFMGNGFPYTTSGGGWKSAGPKYVYTPLGATETPFSDFETFGSVAETDGVYRITEDANAGLFKDMVWPPGAQSVTFRYHFAAAGDGDYLVVYGNTNGLPLYLGSDMPLSRDNFIAGEAPVVMLAGTTNRLTFMLVSRGETNAVLEIKDIKLAVSDDPDGDGLTTTQELALGTDPLKADTDGDGLSDYEEVNTYFTDPTRADTDGDGVGDQEEIIAGTNPRDATSAFAIGAVSVSPSGGVLISWRGVAGKSYNVLRTTALNNAAYETVTNGVPGVAPLTTIEDDSGLPSAFYWVELAP